MIERAKSNLLDNGLGMDTMRGCALINKIANEGGIPTQDNNVPFTGVDKNFEKRIGF